MKATRFWAPIVLSHASAILAQGTTTSTAPSSSASTAPSCTASLITEICDYPSPGPEFAVASSGREHCWQYCNEHQPCDFVMFLAGNPNTGSGTCWLYPGKTYDQSAASTDCGNPSLSVYGKPTCSGGSTPTSGGCAATASPSAIAEICDYPTPPDDCFNSCTASESASSCLSQCAEEGCSFVVFNPRNPSGSPHSSGTCWMYPEGSYDAGYAGTCSGAVEQYVYNNVCPKPSPSSSAASPSGTASSGAGAFGTETTGNRPSGVAEGAEAGASGTPDVTRTDSGASMISGLQSGLAVVAFVSLVQLL